jgi:PAS domain-containing protein
MSYASISPPTLQAFISYAHNDERCCKELLRHLKLIKNVVAWHDRLITPGTHWQQELDQNLEAADIILLLISPAFFDSYYCRREMEQALERHKRHEAKVIPVVLCEHDWKDTELAALQALPEKGKPVKDWTSRDRAYTSIAKGVREIVRKLLDHKARAIAGKLPALLCYVDAELKYQYVNQNYQNWFGSDALIGVHVAKVIGPRFQRVEQIMRDALKGNFQEFNDEIKHKSSGQIHKVHIVYVPHRSDKKVFGFYALVFDREHGTGT